MVTENRLVVKDQVDVKFPINRCQQRVVTEREELAAQLIADSFQSIGVTSEW